MKNAKTVAGVNICIGTFRKNEKRKNYLHIEKVSFKNFVYK